MKVIHFQKEWHGIPEGIRAFAIFDSHTGMYFAWCYKYSHIANAVASHLKSPQNSLDLRINWKFNIQHCALSEREMMP